MFKSFKYTPCVVYIEDKGQKKYTTFDSNAYFQLRMTSIRKRS